MFEQRWLVYAFLSALSASFIAIFGKVGMEGIDSNLATTIRSAIMTAFLLGVCTIMGLWNRLPSLHGKAVGMIALSGIAGAVSWIFYFAAIQAGTVSQVAPIDKLSMPLGILLAVIILGDRPTLLNWFGIAMIAGGAYLAAVPRR